MYDQDYSGFNAHRSSIGTLVFILGSVHSGIVLEIRMITLSSRFNTHQNSGQSVKLTPGLMSNKHRLAGPIMGRKWFTELPHSARLQLAARRVGRACPPGRKVAKSRLANHSISATPLNNRRADGR